MTEPSMQPESGESARIQELRSAFEEISRLVLEDSMIAVPTHKAYRAAIPVFELGLQLAALDPSEAKSLINEVRSLLARRERQLAEQLYPSERGHERRKLTIETME